MSALKQQIVPTPFGFIFARAMRPPWIIAVLGMLYGYLVLRFGADVDLGAPLEASLTLAVGIMLAIRINRAYERWWEARTLWGTLVNVSRNLALKLAPFADLVEAERREAHRLIAGFAHALDRHLRRPGALRDVPGFEAATDDPQHVPGHLAGELYRRLETLRREGRVTETQLLILDSEARMFMEVCGSCERILNTPMTPFFAVFVRFSMLLLLVVMPWEFGGELGLLLVPVTFLATFMVVGGESIAQHVERPFGTSAGDLDLTAYADAIDRSVAEALGVPETRGPHKRRSARRAGGSTS